MTNLVSLALADEARGHAHAHLENGRDDAHDARVDLTRVAAEFADTAAPGDQLALIPAEPKPLTGRQQAVLDALQAAGQDGLDTDAAGAIAHEIPTSSGYSHARDTRCIHCAHAGRQILDRLAELGHARYRRANRAKSVPGAWLATNLTADTEAARGDFGEFPEGF